MLRRKRKQLNSIYGRKPMNGKTAFRTVVRLLGVVALLAGLAGSPGWAGAPAALAASESPPGSIPLPAEAGVLHAQSARSAGIVGLQSTLQRLYEAWQSGDAAALQTFAGQEFIDLQAGTVRVILETYLSTGAQTVGNPSLEALTLADGRQIFIQHAPPVRIEAGLARALQEVGAQYETAGDEIVQVTAPIASLESLAHLSQVRFVRLPLPAEPLSPPSEPLSPTVGAYTSQGVALTKADDAHAAGYDGTGVNLAIFDFGFTGWAARQAAGDLPSGGNLVLHDYSSAYSFSPDTAGYDHGTACAEVAYDMAPGSTVHLYAFGTDAELNNAIINYIAVGGKKVCVGRVGRRPI
jgi:hypothetical protein